ncbi:MAG TPA: hypothetical protein VKQ30_09445 [Ktedonobacterales bacterium]|nr:hypothetical protein [Ktedonobacterales bacterium]
MTGPGGSSTNRDKRRQSRQQQLQQRQLERQRERARKLRQQRIQRIGVFAAGILVVALIAFLIVHAAIGSGGNSGGGTSTGGTTITGTGTYTTAVDGTPRDTMSCLGSEGTVVHIHMYLEIYVNDQPVQVPANTGIVQSATGGCFYPLHVHDGEPNIIHEESPVRATYTLGAFFDLWGQPLSKTQVMQYTADATHPLVFEVFDGNGKLTTYTGNPLALPLRAHDTIVILYNSPNAKPSPYTNWNGL